MRRKLLHSKSSGLEHRRAAEATSFEELPVHDALPIVLVYLILVCVSTYVTHVIFPCARMSVHNPVQSYAVATIFSRCNVCEFPMRYLSNSINHFSSTPISDSEIFLVLAITNETVRTLTTNPTTTPEAKLWSPHLSGILATHLPHSTLKTSKTTLPVLLLYSAREIEIKNDWLIAFPLALCFAASSSYLVVK